jgi:hypothetical protein
MITPKYYTHVLLQTNNNGDFNLTIDSIECLHEIEVYTTIEKMIPAYLKIHYVEVSEEYPEGLKYEYLNGLYSITFFRSKSNN